jgi:hypothetical protein
MTDATMTASGLAGKGEPAPRVLWVMAEDLRAVARVQRGLAEGRDADDVFREFGIWAKRARASWGGARRTARATLEAALGHAAADPCWQIDRKTAPGR